MLIPEEQQEWLRFAGRTNIAADINRRIEAGMSKDESLIYATAAFIGLVEIFGLLGVDPTIVDVLRVQAKTLTQWPPS